MIRKIDRKLKDWYDKTENRKPLVIYGARQTGKTYAVKKFAEQQLKDLVHVNFEINTRLIDDFNDDISPQQIINRLEIFFGNKIRPDKTIIFFDEIQLCPRALTSLKYFAEDAPEYHLVAAGSLLGVALNRELFSFPVGKVETINLYALDFEEFLWSLGLTALSEEIKACYKNLTPLGSSLHAKAMDLYRTYMVVGGMPEVVKTYASDHKIMDTMEIQRSILNAYVADMAKYASPGETVKIMACFDSLPNQLAKDNKKFQYKIVQKGGSATIFGTSLQWLSAAGITDYCYRIEHGYQPPEAYRNLASFKLYMADTGLLANKANVLPHDVFSGRGDTFSGALAENYVAGALRNLGYKLYYWESSSQAEVDFVLQTKAGLIPFEVKATENVRSRSLKVYEGKYLPSFMIRASGKNFSKENSLISLPLYAIYCLNDLLPHSHVTGGRGT